ncbi:DNA-directed RNA polymerase II subunit RPB1-like [Cimex lectularius]|uniref:CPR type cuticle protein n=1 Tax=Cimex lectularius TaxID=79782 RepID=A0A8I6RSF5_CIMLE|nr:DNA-directed RNA polymerase II subunit RPB1-like [Cimex lectularius]
MNAGLKLLIGAAALAVVVECVVNYPHHQSNRHPWPTQVRVHRSGQPGQVVRYRSPVKRVYVPLKYIPHHGNLPINRNHRNQPVNKIRYGPPPNKRSPAAPPPGWKAKRIGPPPPNFGPPRKNRTSKPKHNKTYIKNVPTKYDSYKPINPQVVTDSYGAPKNHHVQQQQYKITSTTYGIPHPTQGSPEPPKKEDVATSYVSVFQGDYHQDRELEAKTSYTFTNTHSYPEKHKGKVYDDLSNHRPVYNHSSNDEPTNKGFQPPKQTFGFQPYDDMEDYQTSSAKDYYKSTSQSSPKPSKSQNTEEFLSPSYYDQKS